MRGRGFSNRRKIPTGGTATASIGPPSKGGEADDPSLSLDWLQGLASMGCTFMELIPNTKRSPRSWTHYKRQVGERGTDSALKWLKSGSGVGLLPTAPLWILDVDDACWVERIVSTLLEAQIVPLMVSTPSGGAHFYFRLPVTFVVEGLKNHLCHPSDADGCRLPIDFKFGPRTLVVAPGTSRASMQYKPSAGWRTPSVVDPRMFLAHGKFWREGRPFLVDLRPLKDRVARACFYLANRAPVSISGHGGHKVLAGVCAHLVRFLDLDPELGFYLLTHGKTPWNWRCQDATGNTFPWSDAELWAACTAAVDAVPGAGVKAWEREMVLQEVRARTTTYIAMMKASTTRLRSHRVAVQQARRLFRWFGVPELTQKGFGDALTKQGIARIRSSHARIQCIPGLDYFALILALLEHKRTCLVEDEEGAGCALMKH